MAKLSEHKAKQRLHFLNELFSFFHLSLSLTLSDDNEYVFTKVFHFLNLISFIKLLSVSSTIIEIFFHKSVRIDVFFIKFHKKSDLPL
ncbi:hypothetical protein EMIT0210MI2_10623 [Priestia megaterium]